MRLARDHYRSLYRVGYQYPISLEVNRKVSHIPLSKLESIPLTKFPKYPVSQEVSKNIHEITKVSKGAKIRNRYNQVPPLTQDTNGKVTNSQLDTTNENQEVMSFPSR